jgi:hypothetical protein
VTNTSVDPGTARHKVTFSRLAVALSGFLYVIAGRRLDGLQGQSCEQHPPAGSTCAECGRHTAWYNLIDGRGENCRRGREMVIEAAEEREHLGGDKE